MTTSTPYIDATRPLQQGPLLGSPNKLKLAVFCANVQRGTTQSHVPETLKATWADSLAVVRAADAAGIEALIPLARWRRAVTTVPDDDRIFETFTWAAAVAAVTSRAQVFATVHIPLVHPLSRQNPLLCSDALHSSRRCPAFHQCRKSSVSGRKMD